jgi:hypothetical protein
MKRLWFLIAVLGFLVALWIPTTQATPIITITDGNSSAEIDANSAGQAGMYKWTIDGVNHLLRQWFWYRVGGGPESSIDSLYTSSSVSGDSADLLYTGSTFTIDLEFDITGGTPGSGTADIAEIIRITNTSASALDFHFFQYTNFDLGGDALDDSVMGNIFFFKQYDDDRAFSETIATSASRFEPNTVPIIFNSLNDGASTNLAHSGLGIQSLSGSNDYEWGYQWDKTIQSGGTFIISKDKKIEPIPEPTSLLLLGFGLVGIAGYAWRRKKKQS